MVGIFLVIESLWGGRDLGEGLLTFEVLFSHPSGDVEEAVRCMHLKFRAGFLRILNAECPVSEETPSPLGLVSIWDNSALPQIILHPQCDPLRSFFKEAAHTHYFVIS